MSLDFLSVPGVAAVARLCVCGGVMVAFLGRVIGERGGGGVILWHSQVEEEGNFVVACWSDL